MTVYFTGQLDVNGYIEPYAPIEAFDSMDQLWENIKKTDETMREEDKVVDLVPGMWENHWIKCNAFVGPEELSDPFSHEQLKFWNSSEEDEVCVVPNVPVYVPILNPAGGPVTVKTPKKNRKRVYSAHFRT